MLVSTLLDEYQREPPPGYQQVSLDQLLRADREAFRLAANACKKGIRQMPDLTRPLDDAIKAAVSNSSFRLLLLSPSIMTTFKAMDNDDTVDG